MEIELVGIRRYPVKSCGGHALARATVQRCGLAGDRRWMVIDADGGTVTARDRPKLLLVAPETTPDGLVLRSPGRPDLSVSVPPANPVAARVHANPVPASPASDAAHGWFSALLDEPVRLVYLDDPARRRPDPDYSQPDDRVSLADGYPLLLTSTDSLAALNELVADGPYSGEGPMPMTRFRPNLVVSGARAWAEDGWRRVAIGAAEFRVAKLCARCVLTTVHPGTGVKGREPLYSLAQHRRWDGQTWFGVNLVPDNPDARVLLGDRLRVLSG